MTWSASTARDQLRAELSDGPTDKLRAYKRCLGPNNGTNVVFKTFDFRRVTNFTTAAAPLGIYINQVLQSTSAIASDDPATGFFTLTTAPTNTQLVDAAYYIQWFIDSELDTFVVKAVQWLGLGTDPAAVTDGLQPSAVKYAAYEAYSKLALKWTEKMSETFRLEDKPDPERFKSVDTYRALATDYLKGATALRDAFYTRQGQALAPNFGFLPGRVREVTPRR